MKAQKMFATVKRLYPNLTNVSISQAYKAGRGWVEPNGNSSFNVQNMETLKECGYTDVQLEIIIDHKRTAYPDYKISELI